MEFEKADNIPSVTWSEDWSHIEIIGNSYGIGISKTYEKILKIVDEELPNVESELLCIFHFRVMNSISMKYIILIFSKLNDLFNKGKMIKVIWRYDKGDSDIREAANELIEFNDFPIDVVACIN